MKAIKYLDTRVIGPVIEKMNQSNEQYRLLVLPDHPTPIRLRTHTANDVPYLLYDHQELQEHTWSYHEKDAKDSGNREPIGHKLINTLLQID